MPSRPSRERQDLADPWLARFDLGVFFVEAGRYAEALSELELCEKRKGEATALFLDDIPTYRYLAPLPYWLGRAQEGMGMIRRRRRRATTGTSPFAPDVRRPSRCRRPRAARGADRLAAVASGA